MQLKGGMPVAQVRDMTVQKRENDLVLATFGRGFYVLDDYSRAARASRRRRSTPTRRCCRCATPTSTARPGLAPAGTAGIGLMAGNWTAPNPPFGAVFTYSVKADRRRRKGWC